MAKKKSDELQRCCRCGGELPLSKYYRSNSSLFAGTGYFPTCKNCQEQEFNSYLEKFKNPRKAIKRMCMAYDIYYADSIFESCDSEDFTLFGKYLRKLNMTQYKGKTFDHSLTENFIFHDKKSLKEDAYIPPKEETLDEKDIEKWGVGFSAEDYAILNSHYKYLKTANPSSDSNQEIFINELCFTNMQKMKAVREGRVDDYNKLADSYRKSFSQAGLKTVRDPSEAESFSMGSIIEMIEKYTPAEYYKNKDLYKDHDGIGSYIERFMLRPLRNLMHGTTDRDYEYYIKDEDDTNDENE